jgi:hypothetical protein
MKDAEWNLSMVRSEWSMSWAREGIEKNDGSIFAQAGYEHHVMLDLVMFNVQPLKARGMLEAAVIEAFTGCKVNNTSWPVIATRRLLDACDRERLRSMGQPLPSMPCEVYRGVGGLNRRRVRGLSWTSDLDVACWFAARFAADNPTVYAVKVDVDDVYFYTDERSERELVCFPRRRPARLPLSVEEIRDRQARRTALVRAQNMARLEQIKSNRELPVGR